MTKVVGTDNLGRRWQIIPDGVVYRMEIVSNGKWTFEARSDLWALMHVGNAVGITWTFLDETDKETENA